MVAEPISFTRPTAVDCFNLCAGTIHVWHFQLSAVAPYLDEWVACLAREECDRMARFVFERDQVKYGLSRGGLRQILGRYVNQDPAALTFEYEDKGKPHLCLDGQRTSLQFNLSHSGDWVVCGVGCDASGGPVPARCTLGVDVEQIRPLRDLPRLAEHCLTPLECRDLAQLPAEQAQAQFFAYWTSKEAYLKATGQGLTRTMSQVKTDLARSQVVPALDDPNVGPTWHLHRWTPTAGYVAALVHSGDVCAIRHLDYGALLLSL